MDTHFVTWFQISGHMLRETLFNGLLVEVVVDVGSPGNGVCCPLAGGCAGA